MAESPVLTIQAFLTSCRQGHVPQAVLDLFNAEESTGAFLRLLELVGALEPISAMRPAANVISSTFEREVDVPVAADADTPEARRIYYICAPHNQSVMVRRLRVTSSNVTAADSGQVAYRHWKAVQFRDMCVATAPSSAPGKLVSMENIALCPSGGFEVYALNSDPNSIARFHIEGELWEVR